MPIKVQSTCFYKKLIFCCLIPYKLAEAKYLSIVDEKLSFKVGTYV